jgi:hypothetical protein
MSGSPSFALVFTDDHRPDLEGFAPVLADLLGLSAIDARLRIRKGRGIFLERLDEAAARRIAEVLEAHGAPAEVLPQERIARLPGRPARLFQADCRADALYYRRNVAESFRAIPWDGIRLVHAGIVATPQYRDFFQSSTFALLPALHRIDDAEARARLRLAMARKAMRREEGAAPEALSDRSTLSPETLRDLCRNQTEGYLDLFVEDRPGFLRADRRQILLDYLGPRGETCSLKSFKRFVGDVATQAARAQVTPIARRLLDGEDLPRVVFDDLAEYERYLAWFCTRRGIAPPEGGKLLVPADTPPLPDGMEVTACPRCGTVVEAGTDRCAYCKAPFRARRRRIFWKVFIPVMALWGLLVAAGLVNQELARRREAVERVRRHLARPAAGEPRRSIEEALIEGLKGTRLQPVGWGITRRGHGSYEVEFNAVRPGFEGGALEVVKFLFFVDLDAGLVKAINPEAERYLPPAGDAEKKEPPMDADERR